MEACPLQPSIDAVLRKTGRWDYVVARSSDGGATWGAAGGTCAVVISASTTSCTDTLATPGTYVYRVIARFRTWTSVGISGNVVVVLLTVPTITAGPPNPSASTSASFSFSGGNGTGYECQLDGGAWSACTSPKAYSGLSSASHTFNVRTTYSTLSGPSASRVWTIDTAAPTLATFPANPTSATTATLTFAHATFPGSFQCKLDAGALRATRTSPLRCPSCRS